MINRFTTGIWKSVAAGVSSLQFVPRCFLVWQSTVEAAATFLCPEEHSAFSIYSNWNVRAPSEYYLFIFISLVGLPAVALPCQFKWRSYGMISSHVVFSSLDAFCRKELLIDSWYKTAGLDLYCKIFPLLGQHAVQNMYFVAKQYLSLAFDNVTDLNSWLGW